MNEKFHEIAECFRLNRIKRCRHLLTQLKPDEDAAGELITVHNIKVCEVEVNMRNSEVQTSPSDLLRLFEQLQDTTDSRLFSLSCGVFYNESTCSEIHTAKLRQHCVILLKKALHLCGFAPLDLVREEELVSTFRRIAECLMKKKEALWFLKLAINGFVKRLLDERQLNEGLLWLSAASTVSIPQEQEDWLRVVHQADHSSLLSLESILNAIGHYVCGQLSAADSSLQQVDCPALHPHLAYFRGAQISSTRPAAHLAWERKMPVDAAVVDSVGGSSLYNLAGCWLAGQEKLASALEYFYMALRRDPQNLLALWNVATCFRRKGLPDIELLRLLSEEAFKMRHQKAVLLCSVRKLQVSLGTVTPWLSLLYHIAYHFQCRGLYQIAAIHYGQICEAFLDDRCTKDDSSVVDSLPVPALPEIVEQRAFCLLKSGLYESCRDVCSATIASNELPLRFYRGVALARLEKFDAALDDLHCVLGKLDPQEKLFWCQVHVNVGLVYALQDRLHDAFDHLGRAFDSAPGNMDAAYSLAFLHSRFGNIETAQNIWAKFKATGNTNSAQVEELEKTLACTTR
ncbi:uncharacterized protein LOC135387898 isoform X2 [Ornithodoros turicata]|uniref:uncharacterized protein LOC135387898 isoform X2 n=1 Tax=Ornithodoros turicata TaxID=34597 RepID=UPI0031399F6C